MTSKKIDTTNIPAFNGGWSYETESIRTTLSRVTYTDNTIRVLEFGCGDSTIKLYNFLKLTIPEVIYDCYETDPNYVSGTTNYTIYKSPKDVILVSKIYDLILIDGPMGEDRKYWYSKIKPLCRPGTIVMIDDWNHYGSFEAELQNNLKYNIIQENNNPFPLKSFKIVEII